MSATETRSGIASAVTELSAHGVPNSSIPELTPSAHNRGTNVAGKYVNLYLLLMPHDFGRSNIHSVRSVGHKVGGKFPEEISNSTQFCDHRLSKNLTISEFILDWHFVGTRRLCAIMCDELNNSRTGSLSEKMNKNACPNKGSQVFMSNTYSFYEYHNTFARKVVIYCNYMNIKRDWSRIYPKPRKYVLSACKVVPCHHCRSFTHKSDICHHAAQTPISQQRQIPSVNSQYSR
ncbi:hypothetical protein CHS0354_036729 [Potamilus streckersoni]|uniref:Uncharacterized protein n=1 Tax=Potamilus streckersoni TaxID=2493646 RepID=A0AAE0WAA9_9BIVA|nr:hypothetical protein CHS0354_036729 [Potamilus streckersoni]